MDLALDWADPVDNNPIPVIMPAHERNPGGDWEASVFCFEIFEQSGILLI